jgi:Zn-dependent peptidase ImmA (M78 family)
MRKLSKRQIIFKRLSKRAEIDTEKLISEMKETVKQDPEVQEKFEEYGVPVSEIDDVHVEFCPLEVSAKTKDGKIYLNKKMLENDSSIKDPTHYLVHELMHYLQQTTGNSLDSEDKKSTDYLDLPTEEEAFKNKAKELLSAD